MFLSREGLYLYYKDHVTEIGAEQHQTLSSTVRNPK